MSSSQDTEKTAGLPETSISISGAVFEATKALQHAGVPEPRRDASALLAHVLSCDRTFIITHAEVPIDDASRRKFTDCVRRRAQGEPLQYITGYQEFYGLEFRVSPEVLIPRPETEFLVEAALNLMDKGGYSPYLCDFGTGSGCIVVTLLQERTKARGIAIDISEAAIRIAHINAVNHGARERVDFIVSNNFAALNPSSTCFDLIVSNPPYVSASALSGLQREVRNHEPLIALSPGIDGLSVIRRLLDESPQYLKPGGYLVFEMGFDQGAAVRQLVNRRTWRVLDIKLDLQGIPRVVALQKLS
jgi:release factor glutamine methyltransferase